MDEPLLRDRHRHDGSSSSSGDGSVCGSDDGAVYNVVARDIVSRRRVLESRGAGSCLNVPQLQPTVLWRRETVVSVRLVHDNMNAGIVVTMCEDLLCCAQVNRNFNALASHSHVWNVMFQRDFVGSAVIAEPAVFASSVKEGYCRRFLERRRRMASLRRQRAEDSVRHRVHSLQAKAMTCVDVLTCRLQVACMVPCLLASLLLLALRLDGLTSITPWIVIAPIWALVGLVLLSVVVTRYLARSANPLSPFFNMTDRGLNNIATMLSSEMQRKEAALCALMTIALLGFPVLLCVKYSSFSFSDKISWPIVFVPLWAMILLYFAVPAYNCRSMNFPTWLCVLATVLCPTLVTTVTIAALAHTGKVLHDTPLIVIPFWILDAVGIVIAVALGASYAGSLNFVTWVRLKMLLACVGMTLLIVVFCVGPSVAFKVLLVLRFRGVLPGLKFAYVMVPLLAVLVVFSGVLLVRAVMVPLSQPSITYIPPTNARFVALVDAELART